MSYRVVRRYWFSESLAVGQWQLDAIYPKPKPVPTDRGGYCSTRCVRAHQSMPEPESDTVAGLPLPIKLTESEPV